MHKLFKSRVVAVATGAMAIVGLGATGATASGLVGSDDIRNNSIQSEDIRTNSLGSEDIERNSIGTPELAPNSVTSRVLQNGAVEMENLSPFVQDKLTQAGTPGPQGPAGPQGEPGDPASDKLGGLVAQQSTGGLVPIAKIGGSYGSNATQLFTLDLPEAGSYLLNANGFFDRIDEGAAGYEAPTTDTYLQLTVRGAGVGATCFTPAVSHKGFVETTCDASSVVTVDAPTTLTVRGFGYNEDRSGFGGEPNSATPQFSVFAQLTAVKVG